MTRFYLDFDGVIANSATECINSAFTIWANENKNVFDGLNPDRKIYLQNEIINFGVTHRYMVVEPENYYCLVDAIAHEIISGDLNLSSDRIKKNFASKLGSINHDKLEKFKAAFFSFRDEKSSTLSDTDWVDENPPTDFLISFLELAGRFSTEIIVVSRKNFNAINKWMCGFGVQHAGIFGNESLSDFKNNKFTLIEYLQDKNNYQRAFFIDDMLSEVDSLGWADINVIPITAGWGYNDLEDNSWETLQSIEDFLNDLFD